MGHDIATLDGLRNQIDQIDLDILRLLNLRAGVVIQIQRLKKMQGLPAYSAVRESEILQNLSVANPGPLPCDAIEDIFRRILQHSIASLRIEDD